MNAPETGRTRLLVAAPWIVVLGGVLVMVVALVIATGYFSTDRPTGAPEPVWPFAAGATAAETIPGDRPASPPSPSSTGSRPPATRSAAAPPPPRPTPARTTQRPPRPAPTTATSDEVTGRYRVLGDYRGSFVGEVLIRNESSGQRQWTVELRFPAEVDDLRGYWAESAPQPELRRSDGGYIFTGRAPINGNSSVTLRFHFEHDGDADTPTTCTVNGVRCELR